MVNCDHFNNNICARLFSYGKLNFLVFCRFSEPQPAPFFPSCRLTLALIGFFMFFHLYAQRVGMSVAIVSMVNHTAVRQLRASQTGGSISVSDSPGTGQQLDNSSAASAEETDKCIRQNGGGNDGDVQKVCPRYVDNVCLYSNKIIRNLKKTQEKMYDYSHRLVILVGSVIRYNKNQDVNAY